MKIAVSIVLVFFWIRVVGQELPEKVRYSTPFVAVVFLAPDCPISQKYMKKLSDLKAAFDGQITFLAVVPGDVSKNRVSDFAKEYNSTLHFESDKDLLITRALLAKVTPEIFLFDKDRRLVYNGAIDNWFYELGKSRRDVTENFFLDAVQAITNNEKPKVTHTEAVGCLIQFPKQPHQHQ